MSTQRTHFVTTTDGVIIGGTVHGQGAPLVFLQGAVGDGDLDWRALVPHLTDRFTCYLPSLRGRGLSGDHPDLSHGRLVDDFLTYVRSIEEPIGLVGWSGGASYALGVAAQSDAVTALATVEPPVQSVMNDNERAALGEALARAGVLSADGRSTDAVRAFLDFVFTDTEVAVAEQAGYVEAAARYVPNLLKIFLAMREHKGTMPDDPTVLGAISAPVLVLGGSATTPWFTRSARHVADHARDVQVRPIPGAGHAAPLTHPEALAEALTDFFSRAPQRA